MHIYLFAPIRYDFLHQRPQKLAEQFVAAGVSVTYVQPTGFRHVHAEPRPLFLLLKSVWYHLLAVFSSVAPWIMQRTAVPGPDQGLRIISLPLVLPINHFNSAFLEALNARVFRLFVRSELVPVDRRGSVAIFQNPFWGKVIEGDEFESVCYDCLDDISLYAGHASLERFDQYERMLLNTSAVIITTAAKLEERLRARTAKPVHRIPNGVDDEWFRSQAASGKVPDDLEGILRPIAGYVGSIAGWLDYELITAAARRLPDVSFVFVGPVEHDERKRQLLQSSNIHWLGRKPYADMPLYINAFDSCLIPFKAGDIARTTNPVKVFEYFALGKPVVATRLLELDQFGSNALVLLADTPDEFAASVKDSIGKDDPGLREERVRIASQHSWVRLAGSFIAVLEKGGAT